MLKKYFFSIIYLTFAGVLMVGCQQVNADEFDTTKAATQPAVDGSFIGERNTANVISLDPTHANLIFSQAQETHIELFGYPLKETTP